MPPSPKAILRTQHLTQRMALSAEDTRQKSIAIAEHVRTHAWFMQSATIAGYMAIRGEVDVLPILNFAVQAGKVTALPVADLATGLLTLRYWQPGDTLEKDTFGIDIPLASAASITPQLILVPLLAFDLRGHRLGYGGGYYDRTLARLRQAHPGIRTLGIAYASQQANSLPDEETDMRLDGIATEQGILIPKGTL